MDYIKKLRLYLTYQQNIGSIHQEFDNNNFNTIKNELNSRKFY